MAIEQTNVVDAVAFDRQTGDAVLTLLDALDWEDAHKHLRLLQAKLEAYLTFVESREVYESYPAAQGRVIRINAIFRHTLPDEAVALLQRAEDVASGLSVAITWQVRPGR